MGKGVWELALLGMFSRNYLASFGFNGKVGNGRVGAGSGLDC